LHARQVLPGKGSRPEQKGSSMVDLFQKAVTQTHDYKDYMEKQAMKPISCRQRMLKIPRGGRYDDS